MALGPHPAPPCGFDLMATDTTQVVPVDLNAWLVQLGRHIAAVARHLGDSSLAAAAEASAAQRWEALDRLAWSPREGCWHDLHLTDAPAEVHEEERQALLATVGQDPLTTHLCHSSSSGAPSQPQPQPQVLRYFHLGGRVLASNWVPLGTGGVQPGSKQAEQAVEGLARSGLLQAGGLLTSKECSGQQWDGPNCWPPLLHCLVEGCAGSGTLAGPGLARQLAGAWLSSAAAAWAATGHMHEKYDACTPGKAGAGGEYSPQVGFGWSNGVLLDLLHQGYRPTPA
ncbi:Six-hairpin glycosidase-like protein [Haematococcus lacustris]